MIQLEDWCVCKTQQYQGMPKQNNFKIVTKEQNKEWNDNEIPVSQTWSLKLVKNKYSDLLQR